MRKASTSAGVERTHGARRRQRCREASDAARRRGGVSRHGTHVAGIVGANGVLKGVAPGVTFHAYRVFGCTGTTSSDIMLEAMERAAADGSDVLNMSIGAAYQWPQYPTSQGADRLVNEGVIVVAADHCRWRAPGRRRRPQMHAMARRPRRQAA
jgi:subtilisin family serine protease